jgi:hypothetical protein
VVANELEGSFGVRRRKYPHALLGEGFFQGFHVAGFVIDDQHRDLSELEDWS